jgi:hypothetical protein
MILISNAIMKPQGSALIPKDYDNNVGGHSVRGRWNMEGGIEKGEKGCWVRWVLEMGVGWCLLGFLCFCRR